MTGAQVIGVAKTACIGHIQAFEELKIFLLKIEGSLTAFDDEDLHSLVKRVACRNRHGSRLHFPAGRARR